MRRLRLALCISPESNAVPGLEIIAPVVVVAIFGMFVYRFFRHDGLLGALYGSRIARTIGEVDLGKQHGASTMIRVYILENDKIVIEHSSKTAFGASVQGVPMEKDAAIQVLQHLKTAVNA